MPRAPRQLAPVHARSGRAYLNLGCGRHYSTEWTNVDLLRDEHVVRHSLTEPLPYASATFAGVYSSHAIEHLRPEECTRLVAEIHRVLEPGGVVRLATPDLERICIEYLDRLTAAADAPRPEQWRRYRWITLELLDQMVREEPGGTMLRALSAGEVDRTDVEARLGDELAVAAKPTAYARLARLGPAEIARRVADRARGQVWPPARDPRRTGEAHKWMYDRVSLRRLLETAGFEAFAVTTFNSSRIPEWERFDLDRSGLDPSRARKPDSIFVEAAKPA